jgi:hypothetical protein
LNAERSVLIRDYIVFVFRVDRLVMGRDVDFIVWKFVFAKVLEQVCISRAIEMDVGVVGVFRLVLSAEYL